MRDVRSALVGAGLVVIGVVLGAVAFGSERVDAQQGAASYRTCVFGHQETHDIDGHGRWERADRSFQGDRIIHIPQGWEVAGSGGGFFQQGRLGFVLICRR